MIKSWCINTDNYLQHTQAGPYFITHWTPVINEAILKVFHKIKITQILKLSMIVDSLKKFNTEIWTTGTCAPDPPSEYDYTLPLGEVWFGGLAPGP